LKLIEALTPRALSLSHKGRGKANLPRVSDAIRNDHALAACGGERKMPPHR
jgi:hypothetical protein